MARTIAKTNIEFNLKAAKTLTSPKPWLASSLVKTSYDVFISVSHLAFRAVWMFFIEQVLSWKKMPHYLKGSSMLTKGISIKHDKMLFFLSIYKNTYEQ